MMDGLMGAVDNPMPGIVGSIRVLPGDAQSRVASLVLPTLALHVHVAMYAMLPESTLDQQDYSLTLRPGVKVVTQPCVLCVRRKRTSAPSAPVLGKTRECHGDTYDVEILECDDKYI